MNGILLATLAMVAGVESTWETTPEGDQTFVVQLDDQAIAALRAGHSITSMVPDGLPNVRSIRLQYGVTPLRKPALPLAVNEASAESPAEADAGNVVAASLQTLSPADAFRRNQESSTPPNYPDRAVPLSPTVAGSNAASFPPALAPPGANPALGAPATLSNGQRNPFSTSGFGAPLNLSSGIPNQDSGQVRIPPEANIPTWDEYQAYLQSPLGSGLPSTWSSPTSSTNPNAANGGSGMASGGAATGTGSGFSTNWSGQSLPTANSTPTGATQWNTRPTDRPDPFSPYPPSSYGSGFASSQGGLGTPGPVGSATGGFSTPGGVTAGTWGSPNSSGSNSLQIPSPPSYAVTGQPSPQTTPWSGSNWGGSNANPSLGQTNPPYLTAPPSRPPGFSGSLPQNDAWWLVDRQDSLAPADGGSLVANSLTSRPTLYRPGSSKPSSWDSPTTRPTSNRPSTSDSTDTGSSTVRPPQPLSETPVEPTDSSVAALGMLFLSMGLNIYFGYLLRGFYLKTRQLARDLRESIVTT